MYLNAIKYSSNPRYINDIHRLASTLDKLANRNSAYPYINH